MTQMDTVSDLLELIEDVSVVTALDVAKRARLSLDEAGLVLESLPLTQDAGVFCFRDGLEYNATLAETGLKPGTPLREYLQTLKPGAPSEEDFELFVRDALNHLRSRLDNLCQSVTVKDAVQRPTKRRRKRGELLAPRPEDPPELRSLRLEAAKEIEESKNRDDTRTQQKVYGRWCQRINAAEKRHSVGVYSAQCVEDTDASTTS